MRYFIALLAVAAIGAQYAVGYDQECDRSAPIDWDCLTQDGI